LTLLLPFRGDVILYRCWTQQRACRWLCLEVPDIFLPAREQVVAALSAYL
jgi:hypothetical protein